MTMMNTSGMKGLYVTILRPSGDSTNDGVTSPENAKKGQALLLGIEGGHVEADSVSEGIPVLIVRRRTLRDGSVYVDCVPAGEPLRTMAGGNFVFTSDSRFRKSVCEYPISVHDRIE